MGNIKKIEAAELFDYQQDRVIIDVRTPAEFNQGHIIGAVNLPLFTNEERIVVGTIYKKQSPEQALLKGLDFVGRKMPAFIKKAQKLAPNRKIIVHCWRGGKRSASMAWLLDLAGFDVFTLVGGYKAYRSNILEHLMLPLNLYVVGGKTGTGKTEILQHLRHNNEQIIDLEHLACHKGSAFGALGEVAQPSTEHFENLLFETIRKLDKDKRIWVENESRSIGTVFLPDSFWKQVKNGILYNVEIPQAERVKRSVEDYKKYPIPDLIHIFKKIEKKLGGQHAQAAIEALEKEDFEKAATIALVYYDKTYTFGLENNITPIIHKLTFEHADMEKIATTLIHYNVAV
jgi:tRNA 2-selenouridine synthase